MRPQYDQTQSSDVTLNVAKLAALFSSLAAALYAATQIEPSPIVELFLSGGPLFAVILWLQKDARRTGVGAVPDWGSSWRRRQQVSRSPGSSTLRSRGRSV